MSNDDKLFAIIAETLNDHRVGTGLQAYVHHPDDEYGCCALAIAAAISTRQREDSVKQILADVKKRGSSLRSVLLTPEQTAAFLGIQVEDLVALVSVAHYVSGRVDPPLRVQLTASGEPRFNLQDLTEYRAQRVRVTLAIDDVLDAIHATPVANPQRVTSANQSTPKEFLAQDHMNAIQVSWDRE